MLLSVEEIRGEKSKLDELNSTMLPITPPTEELFKNNAVETRAHFTSYMVQITFLPLWCTAPYIMEWHTLLYVHNDMCSFHTSLLSGWSNLNSRLFVKAYDLLLETALCYQGCCSKKLQMDGPWKWILQEFAAQYSIRSSYCELAHLKWIMRYINLTPLGRFVRYFDARI